MTQIEPVATESEGTTWADWGRSLAEPVPSGVPIVPGHSELQKDWPSYGKAWGAYHASISDSTAPTPPPSPAPVSSTAPSAAPQPPTTDASELDWETYGRFMGGYHAALDQSKNRSHTAANEQAREHCKGMEEDVRRKGENPGSNSRRYGRRPYYESRNALWEAAGSRGEYSGRPWSVSESRGSWGEYGRSWGEYGRSWGEYGRSWGEYGRSWGEYGRAIGESFRRGPPRRGPPST